MNNIILGEEQKLALNNLISFIDSNEVAISLAGYAGTGKTTITRYIIEYLEKNRIQYTLCAPTHKAKIVLENFTGRRGVTLHKLLSLSPKIEIMNLDLNFLQFNVGLNNTLFPNKGVIIADEASMINDPLFDILIEKCIKYKCKVIFTGDKGQIKPVNADTTSLVFDLPNKIVLNKIYRQSSESGLFTVLPTLREEVIYKFEEAFGTEGSLFCTHNVIDFFKNSIPYFKKAIKNSDILETKLLAYTNDRVQAFNYKIREIIFDTNKEYNKFEFLTGYENLEYNKIEFWNSMDYIIVDEPRESEILIPNFIKLPGYFLNLYNSSTEELEEVFILRKDINKDYLNSLAYHIETARLHAIDGKRYNKRVSNIRWALYYKIIKSFTSPVNLYYQNRLIRKKSFDYGYASSIHKSQGSSINNVFIDMKDTFRCRDKEELRQLQYVAISRAKTNAYILQ